MRFWKRLCGVMAAVFAVALLAFSVTPVVAKADTGPKPSVRVTVSGLGQRECIATLLGKREYNGPWMAWGADESYDGSVATEFPDEETMRRFSEIATAEGYYFYGRGWTLSDGETLAWTYYPPSDFKLLIYFPDTQEFLVSSAYETYAFDSYYQTDVTRLKEGRLTLSTAYGYGQEALALAARILITVAVELAIALPFGFRKKQWLLLAGVNVGTQLMLNLLLNLFGLRMGGLGTLMLVFVYFLLELAVVAVETLLYRLFMNRLDSRQRTLRQYIGYSFAANGASFAVGVVLEAFIPGIF